MIELLEAAYRGRTVLVTGHTGFKGGWLAYWLHALGARVVGFALPAPSERPSVFEALRLERMLSSHLGDIRDAASVQAVIREHEPEFVFHLAAQPLVRASYVRPVETFATNVLGTVHVLEAARAVPSVRVIVNVTTDKCYENREWVWGYREDDRLGGRDPYSCSKACSELVTAAYRASFMDAPGVPVLASARAGNVIGGGDWSDDRLVPDIMRALLQGVPAVLRNPSAIRAWQHVLDPLYGYLLLGAGALSHGAAVAGAWNFGPDAASAVSVRDLAHRVVARWGRGELELGGSDDGLHEATFLHLDSTKARALLGWRPRLNLADAVTATVDWYRAVYAEGADPRRTTESQLAAYCAEAPYAAAR